jgi:hypothetical protein
MIPGVGTFAHGDYRQDLQPVRAADRGAALFDLIDPGWWSARREPAIDMRTLNLNSIRYCTIGQLYPDEPYLGALIRLTGLDYPVMDEALQLRRVLAAEEWYGFVGKPPGYSFGGDWLEIITARRIAAGEI